MGDRERVQVRISPEKKKEWVNAVNDDTTYNNLSHLIIRAVERELSDDDDQVRITNEPTTVDLEPIRTEIQQLRGEIKDVQESVTSIESSAADSSDILDLSREILRLIPDSKQIDRTNKSAITPDEPRVVRSADAIKNDIQEHGRKEDIVEYFVEEGYDKREVELAIEKLKTDMNRVEQIGGSIGRQT